MSMKELDDLLLRTQNLLKFILSPRAPSVFYTGRGLCWPIQVEEELDSFLISMTLLAPEDCLGF